MSGNMRFAAIVFIALTGVYGTATASQTGEIQGRVVEESGEGLPGVEVTAESPNLQGTRSAVTNRNGEFLLPLLPVGTYKLTFRLDGFETLIQKDVLVRLGAVTSLKTVLAFSEIRKDIVVTAVPLLIDKTSSDTSYSITRTDIERLPAQNRTIIDAVKHAPGAMGIRYNTRRGRAIEGQPSFRGEGEEGNTWIIDGLAVSGVRLRNSGVPLNMDAVEEIQVISDPFSPEYASAFGGIINMVTKSGGNEWQGDLALVFTDKSLQAPHRDQLSVFSEPDRFSNANMYANAGGPIIRDKLWLFFSNNTFTNIEETRDGMYDYLFIPEGRLSTTTNNLFSKLTFSPAEGQTLSLTSAFNTTLGHKGGTGLPELFDVKTFSDLVLRLNYKGILSPTTFVEAGLGRVRRNTKTEPEDGNLGPAQYFVEDLARNLNNSYGRVIDNEYRTDASLRLTHHAETETFGRHELSLGLEYYDFSSRFAVDFTGREEDLFPDNGFDAGTKYYFLTLREDLVIPSFFYEYGPVDLVNSSRGLGFFVKDKVTAGRFTLMAGVRSQTQLCTDHNGEKLWSWGFGDFLSPRFTLTADLTGDGVNVLRLGWGLFSDLITTMPLGILNSGAGLSFRTYRWQGGINPTDDQLHNPDNWVFEHEQKSQPFEISPGIRPNVLSRMLLEFSRRLGHDWAVKARYVRAKADNLLEVLAVFDMSAGYKFLFDNFEHKRRDYRGLEFEVTGRIGDTLRIGASYTHALARGTNPGQMETGAWDQEEGNTNYLGFFGNHLFVPPLPGFEDFKDYVDRNLGGLGGRGIGDAGWYGRLPYSVDHNVKINAAWAAPWGIRTSAAFEFVSGYPWEKLGYVPFFGIYMAFPEGRGVRTTPAHAYLDLGLEKSFRLARIGDTAGPDFNVRFDILNILDSQRPLAFIKQDIPIFGQVWSRQQPRQARLTLRLNW